MSSPPRRRRLGLSPARTARVGSAVVAALLVSAVVTDRSSSAFTASTDERHRQWSAGTMTLTASGPASLTMAAGMVPEDTITECVDVTYTGSVPSDKLTEVKLRRGEGAVAGDLAPHLDFTVVRGASCANMGATSAVAQGRLTDLDAHATFETGYPTGWTPTASGDVQGFRITVTLDANTGNGSQGDAAWAPFAWEVRSKPSTS